MRDADLGSGGDGAGAGLDRARADHHLKTKDRRGLPAPVCHPLPMKGAIRSGALRAQLVADLGQQFFLGRAGGAAGSSAFSWWWPTGRG